MWKIQTYQLIIRGKVQNVGFRYWFYQEAVTLGLKGYVKNLNKSSEVESIIQGKLTTINQMLEIIKVGPKLGRIKNINSSNIDTNETYLSFEIK